MLRSRPPGSSAIVFGKPVAVVCRAGQGIRQPRGCTPQQGGIRKSGGRRGDGPHEYGRELLRVAQAGLVWYLPLVQSAAQPALLRRVLFPMGPSESERRGADGGGDQGSRGEATSLRRACCGVRNNLTNRKKPTDMRGGDYYD